MNKLRRCRARRPSAVADIDIASVSASADETAQATLAAMKDTVRKLSPRERQRLMTDLFLRLASGGK